MPIREQAIKVFLRVRSGRKKRGEKRRFSKGASVARSAGKHGDGGDHIPKKKTVGRKLKRNIDKGRVCRGKNGISLKRGAAKKQPTFIHRRRQFWRNALSQELIARGSNSRVEPNFKKAWEGRFRDGLGPASGGFTEGDSSKEKGGS